ncbi:MAG: efflux RND transporter periplasmic adaptor subunit [Desulfovibrio sp.]|nr:efflux RND transporter periplasmic adaptor subunit [Desulfovibrio sp.]
MCVLRTSGVLLCLVLTYLTMISGCEKKEQQASVSEAVPVTLVTVTAVDTPWPAEYLGRTVGSRSVEVRSRVNGVIEERLYTEGQFVREGQPLFRIEKDQYEAAVQEAQAAYNNAEREWNRIRPLYDRNAVSQKSRDEALAERDEKKAALRKAQIDLDHCEVLAPVSGYSGKESQTAGNLVANNDLLTSINQVDPTFVDFAITAPDRLTRVRLKTENRLRTPDNRQYTVRLRLLSGALAESTGTVTFVDTRVLTDTASVRARAEFPNADGAIMPGQYVQITVEGDTLVQAILVPRDCVLQTQKGPMVMVVGGDNIMHSVPVQSSVDIGEFLLVDSGLKGGERLVREGLAQARDGALAKVRMPQESAVDSTADTDRKAGNEGGK